MYKRGYHRCTYEAVIDAHIISYLFSEITLVPKPISISDANKLFNDYVMECFSEF